MTAQDDDAGDPSSSIAGRRQRRQDLPGPADESVSCANPLLDESVAGKFTVLTCASTSCSARRRELWVDDLATYSALHALSLERAPSVLVTESSCLGGCRHAPCVAVEHEDYEGTVSLAGMEPGEFARRVFFRVEADSDVDRVWSCVESAIEAMAAGEDSQESLATSDLENESRFV
jgi:(2Fe-2S) ferredoxin